MLKNLCVKNCVEKTLGKEPLKLNPQEGSEKKLAPTQFLKCKKGTDCIMVNPGAFRRVFPEEAVSEIVNFVGDALDVDSPFADVKILEFYHFSRKHKIPQNSHPYRNNDCNVIRIKRMVPIF